MTNTLCGRLPLGFDDFGEYALSPKGEDKLLDLIVEQLPEEAWLCGTEIYCDVNYELPDGFSISEIVDKARELMITGYGNTYYFEI